MADGQDGREGGSVASERYHAFVADPETRPGAPRPERSDEGRTMARIWFGLRALVLILMIPLIFFLLAPVLMVGQQISAPSWLKARVEAQAASALGGGSLTFGSIHLEVARDLHPTVRLMGTEFRDAEGQLLARVPVISTQLSPRGIIFNREVLPQTISLSGAQIALTRDRDGSLALSFDGASGTNAREAAGLTQLLASVESALDTPALEALETIEADGLILNYADRRAGQSWTVDGGTLRLDVRGGDLDLSSELALLAGRDYVTTINLGLARSAGSDVVGLSLVIRDAPAADIATQSAALSWLAVIDARLDAELDAEIRADGALGPMEARLDIGAGALRPDPRAEPVRFDRAHAGLRFDPGTSRITFNDLSIASEWGSVSAEGFSYLQGIEDGFPEALLSQFRFSDIVLNPPGLYPAPVTLDAAELEFRLRLDPFAIDIGHAGLTVPAVQDGGAPAARLDGRGTVSITDNGWQIAMDGRTHAIGLDQLLGLWPESFKPGTRLWFANNVERATLVNVAAGMRFTQGDDRPVLAMTQEFRDADVRVLRSLPVVRGAEGRVTFQHDELTVNVSDGLMPAPLGGSADLSGSQFRIPDTRIQPAPAEVDLRSQSTITAALSLLDMEPFRFVSKAGRAVTLAQGDASADAHFDVVLRPREPGVPPPPVPFSAEAILTSVTSDRLVPGRTLSAERLTLGANNSELVVGGPMRVGSVAADATFRTGLGPAADGTARIDGRVTLSEAFLEEFNIGLPPGSLSGEGTGRIALRLTQGAPTAFEMTSTLEGLRLAVPALNWTKGPGSSGDFEVSGRLGPVPRVERLSIEAPGLTAIGDIRLREEGGGLDRATFSRVRAGGWLDGPVTLVGRGAGVPAEVRIGGGVFDLRRAQLGGGGEGGGPMSIALDRLQVTDSIALTGFQGDFTTAGGFQGQFRAAVNGGAPVQGVVAPVDGGAGVRIRSGDAGAVLRSAGLFETAARGALDLSLTPAGRDGHMNGILSIENLRIRDAPALASMVDAMSVVGLLQQLDGQGILFSEVDARFGIAPGRITIFQSSAVGPGLGISLDGFYTPADRQMDFQGVLSPLYLINGVGSVLTRPGEGLFGFSYRLTGQVGAHRVEVNPLSVLTPGMFREIFRRPPPEVGQ